MVIGYEGTKPQEKEKVRGTRKGGELSMKLMGLRTGKTSWEEGAVPCPQRPAGRGRALGRSDPRVSIFPKHGK